MKSFGFGILFAVLAGLAAVVCEVAVFLLLSAIFASPGSHFMPRGPGWIAIPVFAGIAGWRFGRVFEPSWIPTAARLINDDLSRERRLWIGYSGLWIVCWSIYCFLFNPFNMYRWSGDDWTKFLFGCFGPIGLVVVISKIRGWANKAGE